jgi:hypothetical protein
MVKDVGQNGYPDWRWQDGCGNDIDIGDNVRAIDDDNFQGNIIELSDVFAIVNFWDFAKDSYSNIKVPIHELKLDRRKRK